MGKFLHTLGLQTFHHPWRVIVGWLATLGLLGLLATLFIAPTSSSISIPGTEAQKTIDRAGELFKGSGGGSGRIVFEAKNGSTIASSQQQINTLITNVSKVDGVSVAVSPFINSSFVSKSGTIAYAQVQFDKETGSIDEATINSIVKQVESTRSNNLQVEVGGDLVSRTPGEIIGIGEIGGVVIALMVLIITFGSLVAAGMPLLSAILAVGVSMAGLFAMSQLFEIGATTPVLAVMLGLAVGIDYSLFIINKYRFYLLRGVKHEDAAARAIGTAGNAVIFAAVTVIIALAALTVVNIPFMTVMGLVGAGSIAVSALVAITLTPALLSLAGDKILTKKQRRSIKANKTAKQTTNKINRKTVWYKWGELLGRRPIAALIIGLLIVGVVALPARDLTLGLPTDQYAAKDTTQRKAYDILTKGFGVGFNAPLIVVVEGLPKYTAEDYANNKAMALMLVTPGYEDLVEQNATKLSQFMELTKLANKIAKYQNVEQAQPATASEDGSAGIIQVIPKTAPADKKTAELIANLRDETVQQKISGSSKVSFAVTGSVALQDDINKKLSDALPLYLAVVVGLSLLLLILAFRSILVPVKATLGFLLSVLAMFGAIVAVFQWGWFGIADAPGPIVSFIPIIAIGILFGLAMDYEFFLVSGMHEAYAHGKKPKDAVVEGFGMGSKVVTAAAVIMISVFGGFITNHDTTIQSIGFGLAIGILIDAFIVRMTIVPAVMVLLGKSAWWLPTWLDRRLPHVSIEGEEASRK